MADLTAVRPQPLRVAIGRRAVPATWALGAVLVAGGILLLYAGRHLTFFYDEWDFVLGRRGGTVSTYLAPHNGHLSLFPILIYKLFFATVGLRHYTPYRIVGILVHLTCCGLLYILARRRIGPWLALAPPTLLLFMGTAFQDVLWPFQMGYLGSVAAGLGALALLEDRGRRGDAGAAALLTWSIASSGLGIPFLAACAVLLLAQRAEWRRFWVIVVPALAYLVWYVGWGTPEHTTGDAVLAAPQYVANAAAGAAAGIAGLDDGTWGAPLAVALFALISVSWRYRRGGAPSPMLLAALTGALAFWLLTAITRADLDVPAASRYLYVGALFIFLVAAEARVGTGISAAWMALAGVLVLGALVGNVREMRAGERGMRAADDSVRASLAAVELASPVVPPGFVAEPNNAPQVSAGPYLAAVRDLGSPALSLAELEHAPESLRVHSDQVLEHAEQLAVAPASSAGAGRNCRRSAGTSLILRVAPGTTLAVEGQRGPSALLYLARFGSGSDEAPFATVAGGRAVQLRFPADRSPTLSWQVRIAGGRSVKACLS